MSQQPTQQQLIESNIQKLVQALCSSSPQDILKAKEYLRTHADLVPRVIQRLQYLNRDKEASYLQQEFGGLPLPTEPTQQQLIESNIQKLVQALCSSSPQDNLKAKEYLRTHADLVPRVIQGLQYLNCHTEAFWLKQEFGRLPLPTVLCVYFLTPPRGICVTIFISILFSVKPWHAEVGLGMRSLLIKKMYLPIHVDNNILSPPHPNLFPLFFSSLQS